MNKSIIFGIEPYETDGGRVDTEYRMRAVGHDSRKRGSGLIN